MSSQMTIAAVVLILIAGCYEAGPAPSPRVAALSARTTYDHGGAKGDQNAHIPKHDPAEMVRLFEEHKMRIVGVLAPYLRTYDGADYADISIRIYAKPVPPDGRKVGFHVSVVAEMGADDDSYLAGLVLDRATGKVTKDWLSGQQLHAVPGTVLKRAKALARAHDDRYEKLCPVGVRWVPRWYVVEEILPGRRAGEGIAREYSPITEAPVGHVVLLPYELNPEGVSRGEVPCHIVVVDIGADRVLGVHETTVRIGPWYERRLAPDD